MDPLHISIIVDRLDFVRSRTVVGPPFPFLRVSEDQIFASVFKFETACTTLTMSSNDDFLPSDSFETLAYGEVNLVSTRTDESNVFAIHNPFLGRLIVD